MVGVLLAAMGGARAGEVPFTTVPPRRGGEGANESRREQVSGVGRGGEQSNNRGGERADGTRGLNEQLNGESRQAGERRRERMNVGRGRGACLTGEARQGGRGVPGADMSGEEVNSSMPPTPRRNAKRMERDEVELPEVGSSAIWSRSRGETENTLEQVKELRREMRELREEAQRETGETLPVWTSPFSLDIMEEDPPKSLKEPIFVYDGTTDPEEHLGQFEHIAILHRYTDGIKCWLFLTTLVRVARQWFSQLRPNTINSFSQFSYLFRHQFASARRQPKTVLALFSMGQKEGEGLRGYLN